MSTRLQNLLILLVASLPVYAQNRHLTVAMLVNSQNTGGYNPSIISPGEYQRFVERYLEHLQVPYEVLDVAAASPPLDLNSRQLIIAGHSRLSVPPIWRDAITSAVNAGTGFVNLDSDPQVGTETHIAAIFGATGSFAGIAATQVVVPAAVSPNGSTPHYIAAMQKKFDDPSGNLTYSFHAGADGIIRSARSTVLLNAQGTIIARLGSEPLILAKTYGAGRAVHFGTLDYLRADRFGFLMGVDDLFWRSLVWAARKPFVVRGYPRLWSVQMDDTRVSWPLRVGDMYNPAFTGQVSADGTGGPWKVTGYLYTDNLAPGSSQRTTAIADINAGKLEVSPHTFIGDVNCGNMYWNTCLGALTDQQWITKMSSIDSWKQGNGGADVIPSLSRSLVAHYWDISDNTGYDLWNRYGFRYITSIQKSGFQSNLQNNGAERLPVRPFWLYEMPPKIVADPNTPTENFPLLFADDYTVRSRSGLPAQTFFLFATQYLDFAKYSRVDFSWPNAAATPVPTVASSVGQLQQYTWRHWSGLGPVQLFTHDAANYENSSAADRQAVIAQSSSWLNANGVRHMFMDDLGDYIYARTKSILTRATFDGTQLTYTFTGTGATADGNPVSTQLLVFQGDTEGAWQTIPGFTGGLQISRALPPAILSITPSSGPANGGTSVTITGTGFTADSSVFFGQSAASATFVNSSTLQAVTPAAPQGSVDVRVMDSTGTADLYGGFTYTSPPRVLVAAYSFDEGSGMTAVDFSGHGNTGTISGAAWNPAGRFGKALSFNGTNSWVTVNDSSSLRLTAGMTLEAWVNPVVLGSIWRTVIIKEQPAGLIYSIYANTDTNRASGNIFTTTEQEIRSTAALGLNIWTHLAATYDGSTLRLFVNGAQVSSKAVTGAIKTSTGVLRIGGNAVWGEYFSGLIDEVRIYDRASTAAEIQSDMNSPLGDTTPPVVSMTAPANGATVSGTVTISANATDDVGVVGVQFLLDGAPLGSEDTAAPYSISWNSAAATNGSHTLTARARDAVGNQTTSVAVSVTVSNVAADTTPPVVSITAPANGATVSGTVTISANATDDVGVVGVQFLLDGAPLGSEDTAAPYSISWNSAAATNGSHTLTARARDAAGNQTTSVAVSVTVSNVAADTTPPVVSITAPANGATVSGTVTISANATDDVGVVGVQFLLDGAPLGSEDTAAPYSISWNSAAATNGSHTLTARARDAAGNQTTSVAVSVTVSNVAADTTPPVVSITAPANGAKVSGIVTVSANASDNVGVVGVQFLLDGAPLGSEDTAAPYSISWDSSTSSTGSHTLTARARDAVGNQTTAKVNIQRR